MKYKVYLSLYGKKIKVSIEAPTSEAARIQVRNDVKFHKIVGEDEVLEMLKNMMGMGE